MDWNDNYARQETPWEKGRATPVLAEVFARQPDLFEGRILVPGCGTGHDVRWIAAHGRGSELKVTGVDIAPLAIERAQASESPPAAEYLLGDLFNLPSSFQSAFDLVWEHTCLCALDPSLRQSYAQSLQQAVKPGGLVAGVFFINPEMDPGETGPPFGIEVAELEALWQGVGFEIVDSWVPATGYEGRVGRERVLLARRTVA